MGQELRRTVVDCHFDKLITEPHEPRDDKTSEAVVRTADAKM